MKKKITSEQLRLTSLLESYSHAVKVDISQEKISELEGEKLFNIIIRDYVKGIITVDDLSSFCEMSYSKLSMETELYSLLLTGAEVEWYIRHKPSAAANAIEDLIRKFSKVSLEN